MTDELRAEFAALKGEIAALGVKLKPRRNLSVFNAAHISAGVGIANSKLQCQTTREGSKVTGCPKSMKAWLHPSTGSATVLAVKRFAMAFGL